MIGLNDLAIHLKIWLRIFLKKILPLFSFISLHNIRLYVLFVFGIDKEVGLFIQRIVV